MTSDFQSEVRNAIAEPVITRPPLADPKDDEPEEAAPTTSSSDRDGASFI